MLTAFRFSLRLLGDRNCNLGSRLPRAVCQHGFARIERLPAADGEDVHVADMVGDCFLYARQGFGHRLTLRNTPVE